MLRYGYIFAFGLLALGWFGCRDAWDVNQPPVITSSTSTTAILDLPFSYTASAEDPDHDTIEFVYSQLPDWLTVEGNTVHGIPTSTGTYQFSVTAQDNDGESDRITVTVQVNSNTGLIESIVEAVSLDSLLDVVGKLSGASMVDIFDHPYYIKTRLTFFVFNELAAKYLERKFDSFGLLTGRFNYNSRGSNIIALQPGSVYPDSIYIIGAHYDCTVSWNEEKRVELRDAPGADNNASGVAAVLEAARILSQFTCRYSILYILWDENEEVKEDKDQLGYLGSTAYAKHIQECDMKLAGLLDMDMIAYDANDDGRMVIHGSTLGRSPQMVARAVDMIDLLNLNLVPNIVMEGKGSDNIPFNDLGYSTICFTEDSQDYNRNSHSKTDTIDKFNNRYFHQMSKMIIATLAYLTGVESEGVLPPSTFWFCI
jgi:hypothetical protein